MTQQGSWPVCLAVVLCYVISTAHASCYGNACPEHAAAAKSAGLLGSTGSLRSCTPQTYPKIGTLQPVSLRPALLTLPVSQLCCSATTSPLLALHCRSPSPPGYWNSSGLGAQTEPATKRHGAAAASACRPCASARCNGEADSKRRNLAACGAVHFCAHRRRGWL